MPQRPVGRSKRLVAGVTKGRKIENEIDKIYEKKNPNKFGKKHRCTDSKSVRFKLDKYEENNP